jgi:hypothetical protein
MVDSLFGKNFRSSAQRTNTRASAPRNSQRTNARASAPRNSQKTNARASAPRNSQKTNARASAPNARTHENIIRDNIKIRRIEHELSELLIEIEELTRKIRSSKDIEQMTKDIMTLNPKNKRYNLLKEEYEALITQQKPKM